jgi:hypothetical protein
MTKTNMQSALARVTKTDTTEGLHKLNKSFDAIYNAGQLSEKELSNLDTKIMHKLALLDQSTQQPQKEKSNETFHR